MFKFHHEIISWPNVCIVCGKTCNQGCKTITHRLDEKELSGYGMFTKRTSSRVNAVIHICEICSQKYEFAKEQHLSKTTQKKGKIPRIVTISLAVCFLMIPMTIYLPVSAAMGGLIIILGFAIGWLGYFIGMMPKIKEDPGIAFPTTPFEKYVRLHPDGTLFFGNHAYYSIFKRNNPKIKVRLGSFGTKNPKEYTYFSGCCCGFAAALSLVLFSLILFRFLIGM